MLTMKPTVKNDSIVQHLQKTGLGEKASIVYTTLLEMGGAYPSALAHETKLNRSTIYKILLDLTVKGLVTEIEKGKKLFYQVEKPEKLLRFAKMQHEISAEAYEKTKALMPDLEGLFQITPNKPKIRYFQDMDGVRSIFEDHISGQWKKYEMLGFANTTELEQIAGLEYLRAYAKRKETLGITTRGIVPDSMTDKTYTERVYKGIKKNIWLKLRYIPKDQFPFNGEITIYGTDRVSIFNFDEKHLVGIIIEDKAIHDMMVRIFELAWKGAGK